MQKVYVLLPVHNRKETTRTFVECLRCQTFSNYCLVLIDDGCADGTADAVRGLIPDVVVLRGAGAWWWAGSLQRGIDWLRQNNVEDEAIVLMINDDVTFDPGYLERAVSAMSGSTGMLLLSKHSCDGGMHIDESGVVANLKRLTFGIASPGEEINCLSTRGLFIHWGDIKGVGNFHPKMLPHYLSDYEYTLRAGRKGMRLRTDDSVFLCPDFGLTGHHSYHGLGFVEFLRKYFSIKSAGNPVYWSAFVMLAVPKLWMLPNLIRVWYRAAAIIARQGFVVLGNALRRRPGKSR